MKLPDEFVGRSGQAIVISAVLLFAAFLVGMLLDYGVHNDYSVFSYDNRKCCLGYPESQHLFWIGRPLGAFLLNIQLIFVDQISGFRWLRVASFLLVLVFFVGVYVQFRREARGRNPEALLTSFSLVLLPGPILYMFWITNAVPGLVNLILATFAYTILYAGYTSSRLSYYHLVAAYGLLFLTFLIYPPTSYFFLVFTCWRVLMTDKLREKTWLMRSYSELTITALLSGVYVIILKAISTPEFVGLFFENVYEKPTGPYSTEIAENLMQRIAVAGSFAARSLQMWLDDWINYPLVIGVILILLLIGSQIGSLTSPGGEKQLGIARIAIPIASFILASGPTVAASGGFVAIRNSYVGSAIASLVLLSCVFCIPAIFRKPRIGLALGGLIALSALAAGGLRFSAAAFNAHLELSYVRKILSQYKPRIDGVTVYRPSWGKTIVGGLVSSDFAYMAVNRSPIDGFPRGVLKEMGLDYRWIPVTYTESTGTVHVSGNIEICMGGAGFVEDVSQQDACYRQVSSLRDSKSDVWITLHQKGNIRFGIARAFDHSTEPTSFWEALVSAPVIFDAEFQTPQVLSSYSFYSGAYEADRMPASWKIFGSLDGKNWTDVDSHSDSKPWALNEKRRYLIQSSKRNKFYRFVFEKSSHSHLLRIYEISFTLNGS